MLRLPVLLLALSLSAVALGQESLPPWYLGFKAGLVGGERAADDGVLYGLELGRQLSPRWTVEVDAFVANQDFDAGFELQHQGLAINLIQVNRAPLWDPYFLIGLGALRFDVQRQSDSEVMVNVAIGGMWELRPKGPILRADLRYRYAPIDTRGLEDGVGVFSLGLLWPLGH